MITISILGLDQYVIGKYSKDHSKNLADLYETDLDNINFYAPNCYIFHDGVEQTSWNTIVRIHAPEEYEQLEEKVFKYLEQTLKEFSINLQIEFFYYHKHHHHEYINSSYPRYIKEDNIVNVEDEELEEGEELYEGNIFEGFEDKLEEACNCDHKHHNH